MRFKDTDRFRPVIDLGDLPHEFDLYHYRPDDIPKTLKERTEFVSDMKIVNDYDWWRKQYDRCINGYTVEDAIEIGGDALRDGMEVIWRGDDAHLVDYDVWIRNKAVHISGRYYFFLNFWPIFGLKKDGKVKTVVNPRFLDHQFLFDLRVKKMYSEHLDTQEVKGRQLGFSEMIAGMMLGWNYTFLPASVNLIVAGIQEDADHTMENTIKGLDRLINTQFYLRRKRAGDSSDKIISITGSEVRAHTAKDKAQTLSRYSPTLVVYEEIGKGKKKWSLDVEGYVKPSIWAEGVKTGYQVMIGTGGSMDEGVYDLEQRHYEPEKKGILSFPRRFSKDVNAGGHVGSFTPKWMFRKIDSDGNSLRALSIEDLKKAAAKALTDEERYNFWTQHPIYDDDVFMTNTGGYFGKDIIMALNKRRLEIRNHRELQITKRGRLTFKNPEKPFDGIEFIHDEDNWWIEVVEEPELDQSGKPFVNLYKAGTDSYDQDEAETSASEGAMIIRKMYRQGQTSPHYNQSVAMIKERPKTAEGGSELFYLHTAMGCLWFGAQNNIEYGPNNFRIFDFYKKNKFEVLLKTRPEMAFGDSAGTKQSNRYGTIAALKPQGLAILKNALTPDYINRMYIIREIEALSRFKYVPSSGKKYNCDITMAKMESEIIAKDEEMLVVFSKSEKKRQSLGIRSFVMENGRIIQKFV